MAKKTKPAFQKGDKVIHPYHGGGIILDIVKKKLGEEIIEYYLVNIACDSLTLYIPTGTIDKTQIKKIESKHALEECLILMRKNNFKLISKPAPLEIKVREKISEGRLLALAEAIGLIWRFKLKKEKEGKISPLNKNLSDLLNHAKKLFIGQLALIRNMEYSSAESYLNHLLNPT